MQKNEFKESFLKIALPAALQNLLFFSFNFIDAIMVGRLGQSEFNATSLGAQFFFISGFFSIGIISSTIIYMAQYFGNKEYKNFRAVVGFAIILSVSSSFIFSIIAILFPKELAMLFTNDEKIIHHAIIYLRIAGFQAPLSAFSKSIGMSFRVSKNGKLTLFVSTFSILLNTLLNYLLIFGKFSFPEMRVAGAALATVISMIFGNILYVIVIIKTNNILKSKIKEYFSFSKELVKKISKTGWSVVLHECLWSIGVTSYGFFLSNFSKDAYSSYHIAYIFARFVITFSMGVSSAASVTIGMQLGRKDIKKALEYEKKYTITQMLVAFVSAIFVIVVSRLMIGDFNVSESVREDALYMVTILCLFFPFTLYNGMQAAGILRAGGDTRVPVILELLGIYAFKLPALLILHYYSKLEFTQILLVTSFADVFVSVLIYKRVKSKKWAKNLIS